MTQCEQQLGGVRQLLAELLVVQQQVFQLSLLSGSEFSEGAAGEQPGGV
jgi:hypothetical protein